VADETRNALEASASKVAEKLKAATLRLAEGAVEITADQLHDLDQVMADAGQAIAGDERAKAHLEAQFKLRKFSTEARGWLELDEYRRAVLGALKEVGEEVVSLGAKAAVQALVGALASAGE